MVKIVGGKQCVCKKETIDKRVDVKSEKRKRDLRGQGCPVLCMVCIMKREREIAARAD